MSRELLSDSGPLVDVTAVRILSRYIIELDFDDGATRVIDLEPHLWGEAFRLLLADYEFFKQVGVDPVSKTIVWPNGADFAPEFLYANSKPAIP